MPFEEFHAKMAAAGVAPSAIRCFERSYALLLSQDTGLLPESQLEPVASLPTLQDAAASTCVDSALLDQCALIKLNGGLGTSMGLEKAKSLLEVRSGLTFLDLIGRQVTHFRDTAAPRLRFLLMNSFSTSEDTRSWLTERPELGAVDDIELMQNMVPKVDAITLSPASWSANPSLEWCPPGHGDLYTVLAGGALEKLWDDGIRFLFVSNSDNLGASLDPVLLTWFADSKAPFLMEVTRRTSSDRKGGHLARRNGSLILRESAQCPEEDLPLFQDIDRHRYFNTNNLWLRLEPLKESLAKNGGFLPLPLIRNKKTVDPRDKNSPEVYQLETAMGAAIECFAGSAAIEVPRSRFAPVKTTADLMVLRSDAYEITDDSRPVLVDECNGIPPVVELDTSCRLVDGLEEALTSGIPSLRRCRSLTIHGPVRFGSGVILEGDVIMENTGKDRVEIPGGTYSSGHYFFPALT